MNLDWWLFPDEKTLTTALRSRLIPKNISESQVQLELHPEGLLLSPQNHFPPASARKLALAGIRKLPPTDLGISLSNWWQALSLIPDVDNGKSNQGTVLFHVPSGPELLQLIEELLRLGCDRQSIRYLETGDALLRVSAPPYYTMLRALDPESGIRVFLETAPRLWIRAGYRHPAEKEIALSEDRICLIDLNREWVFLQNEPFQEIGDRIDWNIGSGTVHWATHEGTERFQIPLKLIRSSSTERPELWVLNSNQQSQLEELAKTLDDLSLTRLAFAVGIADEEQVTILKIRPGKGAPPILILDGIACSPLARISNVFIPCQQRLSPPIRRETANQLFAGNPSLLVWLHPLSEGKFQVCEIEDSSFRPLSDWVDYVIEESRKPLTAWIQSSVFNFSLYTAPGPTRIPLGQQKTEPKAPPQTEPNEKSQRIRIQPAKPAALLENEPVIDPDQLRAELRSLEQEYIHSDEVQRRIALWQEMGGLNARMKNFQEAALCFSQYAWFDFPLAIEDLSLLLVPTPQSLDQLQNEILQVATAPTPSPQELNRLAFLILYAEQNQLDSEGNKFPSKGTMKKCNFESVIQEHAIAIQSVLQTHAKFISVRLLWLVWLSLYRILAKDVLLLARARDSLLERLFQQGLSPDVDLPTFLRFTRLNAGDRLRSIRDHIGNVREIVQKWFGARINSPPTTRHYADLMFAYALARVGDPTASSNLADSASQALLKISPRDPVHIWLAQAFRYRIDRALAGDTGEGGLPESLLQRLTSFDKHQRYKIDRLIEHSRILAPFDRIDPYRLWHGRHQDKYDRAYSLLADIQNRVELIDRFEKLNREFWRIGRNPAESFRVLLSALNLAPRLGEAATVEFFPRVVTLLEKNLPIIDYSRLFERALFVAAHFDLTAEIQSILGTFIRALKERFRPADLVSLETVLSHGFRGLRRVGLESELTRLHETVTELHLRGEQQVPVKGNQENQTVKGNQENPTVKVNQEKLPIRVELAIAIGQLSLGKWEQATPILNRVQEILLGNKESPTDQTILTCRYLLAIAELPLPDALIRIKTLFSHLDGIHDSYTTNSHYSLSQLDVVEEVIHILASTDFRADPAARRWLDEDEFLIRRRIHRDMRLALNQS